MPAHTVQALGDHSVYAPDDAQLLKHASVHTPFRRIAHVERAEFVNEPKILRVMVARVLLLAFVTRTHKLNPTPYPAQREVSGTLLRAGAHGWKSRFFSISS